LKAKPPEPALQVTMGFDHVGINVADLERSLRFYCRVLGLELAGENGETFLRLPGSASTMAFIPARGQRPQPPHLDRECVGLSHLAFRLNRHRFNQVMENLRREELDFTGPIRRTRSESIYFDDPDGNRLEIIHWDEPERPVNNR